jgi:leucyl-tRNA synthetase
MIGNKPFVLQASWPKSDEKKIDLAAEAQEASVHAAVNDIKDILMLVKIEKPKKVTIIVAESWIYGFVKKLKSEIEKTYNVGELIRATMDQKHGAEIAKLVPRLVKDRSKIPDVVTSQDDELAALKNGKSLFAEEFGAIIDIVKAEDSKDVKAKNALPGKPAIIIE